MSKFDQSFAKGLYCIYDTVAKEASAPFLANNVEHARLQFDRAVSQAAQQGFKQEFRLLHVADFEPASGYVFAVGDPIDVTFEYSDDDPEQKELFK